MLLAIVCAARGQQMPNREALTKLFLNRQDVPEHLKSVFQFAKRYEGPTLVTYTDMIDAAQQAGIIRRFNPGHVNVAADLDPLSAQHLLQMTNSDFNDDIAWLEKILDTDQKVEQTRNDVSA
jgi:hypothetical protein